MDIDNIISSTLSVVASSGIDIKKDSESIEKSIAFLIENANEKKTTGERK
jgi:hypothetical protein